MPRVIISGMQPTGPLHIGNYLGALQAWVDLQKRSQCFFFIADLHSLTENFDPKEKASQIRALAATYFAAGIDPKRSVVFAQSQVDGHTELGWILNCVTPIAQLERMTQFKDKAEHQQGNINAGLFTYPVLQAADILLYRGTHIPVGEDQYQHVELTRDITRWFNHRFGKTFTEVTAIPTAAPRVKSLLDPNKKMSKSHGVASYIALTDPPDMIHEKIKRAVTDTAPQAGSAMSSGVANLFLLLKHFGSNKDYKRFEQTYKDGSIRYSELKDTLAKNIADHFSEFRVRYKKLMSDPKKIDAMLDAGARTAQKIADTTMKEVRKKVGLIG